MAAWTIGSSGKSRRRSMLNENESQVTTHEKLATYNMLMAEALFELLVEKGILSKEEFLERVENLRRITKITIQNAH
jgi:flagellin-specific chaperone FliS